MDTYALALGVIANLLHIKARNDFQDVRFRARRTESGSILVIPSLLGVPVDRVIIQSVTGYEINVIFIRGEIVSAKESRIRNDISVPPRKSSLTRLNPRRILYLTRLIEIRKDIGRYQGTDLIADHQDPPRRLMG